MCGRSRRSDSRNSRASERTSAIATPSRANTSACRFTLAAIAECSDPGKHRAIHRSDNDETSSGMRCPWTNATGFIRGTGLPSTALREIHGSRACSGRSGVGRAGLLSIPKSLGGASVWPVRAISNQKLERLSIAKLSQNPRSQAVILQPLSIFWLMKGNFNLWID